MKTSKKILSLVLALVMLFSAVPATVFAAEPGTYAFTDSMTASLELESEVIMVVSPEMTVDGKALTAAEAEAVEGNVGILLWDAATAPAEAEATADTCENVVMGAEYNAVTGRFDVRTEGIAAKNLGDSLAVRSFYVDGEGNYTYGKYVASYSPKKYCYNQISGSDANLSAVCVALLNYGAAAQTYFRYNTENMMNAELTPAQQQVPWRSSLVRSVWGVAPAKEGALRRQNPPINSRGGSLELEGALNVVFTGGVDASIEVAKAQMLLWDEAAFNGMDVLTAESATEVVEMTLREDGKYEYVREDIPAKAMFDTIYACQMYTDVDGNVYYGGVLPFCAERYGFMKQFSEHDNLSAVTKAMIVYGDAARTYFSNQPGDDNQSGSENLTAGVELNADGTVKEAVSMDNGEIGATVPAGVAADKTTLTLQVSEKASSDADVETDENETTLSLDVHVDGVAAGNTKAIIVKLGDILPKALNIGNVALYHVEGGVTNEMTRVMTMEELDEHNEYYYDPVTGEVYVALASFSEITMVAGAPKWEGNYDYTWYKADASNLTIVNADQLAGFSAIVGGMDGQTADSFKGKTVKLLSDINIGDLDSENGYVFYPVGYYNTDGTYERTGHAITSSFNRFEGTFDGNGHTISNFYQNTWEMKGDNSEYAASLQYYRDGMGLFGKVYGGTVKNLIVDNFSSDGEYTTTGAIAAYADCGATFENITIFNCNPRVYNIGNGGIVGCVGWYAKDEHTDPVTFKNITVDNTNKISALWGSWDVACGGIVGQYYPTSGQTPAIDNGGIHMDNCHVSAQIDVYNDVCANYQYYAYRYAGILIGSVRENETIDGRVYPKMDGITAEGCTVHFGDWNDYYYCELVANTLASYTHDHQMSRLEQVKSVEGTTVTYLDGTTGTVPASGRYNYVVVKSKDADGMWIHGDGHDYAECYHFVNGEVWNHADAGEETVDGTVVLKEDKQLIYREFNNLVTGYGWGVTSVGLQEYDGVVILDGVTAGDIEESVVKFADNSAKITTDFGGASIRGGATIKIGDLFKAADQTAVAIDMDNVQVTVSPATEDDVISATYTPNTTDWTQGTLTFSADSIGNAKIIITDYYFCEPTEITVKVYHEKHVLDTPAVNLMPSSSSATGVELIADRYAHAGQTVRIYAPDAGDYARSKLILSSGGSVIFHDNNPSRTGYLTFGITDAELLASDTGHDAEGYGPYTIKKISNKKIDSTVNCLYGFGDLIQVWGWNKMRSRTVDIYVSFRTVGSVYEAPFYFIDRIVAVSKCEHSETAEIISEADCLNAPVKGGNCTVCGHYFEAVSGDPWGHSFDGERVPTTAAGYEKAYNVACTNPGCNYTYTYGVLATSEGLPEVVTSDPAYREAYVYDFSAYNGFRYEGACHYVKDDADSLFTKAYVFDPWGDGEFKYKNPDGTYRYDHDLFSTGKRGAMNFRFHHEYSKIRDQILNAEMVRNAEKGGYHYYKLSWKIPHNGIGLYVTGVFDWNFQFFGKNQTAKIVLDSLRDKTVDVYIRMKVEGDIFNSTDSAAGPRYYFDRFIIVEPNCEDHFNNTDWHVVTTQTCTTDRRICLECSSCGAKKYQTNALATGHTVVEDAAVAATCTETGLTAGSHCSVCNTVIVAQEVIPAVGHSYTSNGATTTCSKCGLSKTFGAALPAELVTILNTQNIDVDKVTDLQATKYMGPTYNVDGTSGDNSGLDGSASTPWKVATDATSPYGTVYRMAVGDCNNGIKFLLLPASTSTNAMNSFAMTSRGDIVTDPTSVSIDTVMANNNGQYHLYKFSCLYPNSYEKAQWIGFVNSSLRSHEDLWQVSGTAGFRDHNVDIYISVKTEGELWNSSKVSAVWYVDRLIVVDRGLPTT